MMLFVRESSTIEGEAVCTVTSNWRVNAMWPIIILLFAF